jgi:hypothetical protein
MRRSIIKSILGLALILLAAGCAHSLRTNLIAGPAQDVKIRVVDAQTGHPLAGVNANWQQHVYSPRFGEYHFGPTNLPPSGNNGIILVPGIRSNCANRLILARDGYATVYAGYWEGALAYGENHSTLDGVEMLEQPLSLTRQTNGFISVPMRQR